MWLDIVIAYVVVKVLMGGICVLCFLALLVFMYVADKKRGRV